MLVCEIRFVIWTPIVQSPFIVLPSVVPPVFTNT
jgi:hypothetical protein